MEKWFITYLEKRAFLFEKFIEYRMRLIAHKSSTTPINFDQFYFIYMNYEIASFAIYQRHRIYAEKNTENDRVLGIYQFALFRKESYLEYLKRIANGGTI